MKPFFSSEGINTLSLFPFNQTLYAFDFDGTLAPVIHNPDKSNLSPTTSHLLQSLAEIARLAIISGRSVSDLKSRLNFLPDYLIGNHGMEGIPLTTQSIESAKAICDIWKCQLAMDIHTLGKLSEVTLEDKFFSLALHFRQAKNKKMLRMMIHEKIHKLDPPPKVIPGKSVINLLPMNSPNKGHALLELIMRQNYTHAFYAGDDETDEDIFTLSNKSILTVRVGHKKTSQAQFFIKKQCEINHLLREILRQLHAKQISTKPQSNPANL